MELKNINGFLEELSSLIRARYPLIHVNTHEEARALDILTKVSEKRAAILYIWSRTEGIIAGGKSIADIKDPAQALKWYSECNEKSLFCLKDYGPYLKEPAIARKLRDLAHSLKHAQKNIIFLSPGLPVPTELSKEVAIVELPLPSREELKGLVERVRTAVPQVSAPSEEELAALVDAASGLTWDEAENVLARSIVSCGHLDKLVVQDEKRQIVKKSGLLEFIKPQEQGAPEIGGLRNLRHWLSLRRGGLSEEARQLGLPLPKGILLVGIPGCGKSLTAMTVGREWQLPLLRLDLGKVFSGIVGSSENNVRNTIATCEAVAPCILWIDEIEKGLSGTASSGQSDGGTTSRVFGTLLTWMQEKKSAVFVVATANDISQLPPEFLRKGRFDEIFFVDLPTRVERAEIFQSQTKRYRWEAKDLDLETLVEKTDGFSGAEIEQVLIEARYQAFGKKEAYHQSHLLLAIAETVPLSRTMGDRIDTLRAWAKHRARPASSPEDHELKERFANRAGSLELS